MSTKANSPQMKQLDVQYGCFKGEVVDDKDPEMRGRVRVWLYGLYGDFKGRFLSAVPWAEISPAFSNGHSPPDIWDRALVMFDCGNFDAPIVIGYWKANPTGAGTLPHNRVTGTEVPPEAWHHHSLTPEVTVVCKTGEGNAIWLEDKQLNENNVFSSMHFEDTGGKRLRFRSFFKGQADYTEKSKANISQDLYKVNLPERVPLRDGLSPEVLTPVPGSIELGHQNVTRFMVTDDNTYSTDSMSQKDGDGSIGVEVQSTNGLTHKIRQGTASMIMNSAATSFAGAVNLPSLLSVPDLW